MQNIYLIIIIFLIYIYILCSFRQYLKKGNEGACKIQGLTIQFFFISSILWTAVIALNIYLVVVIKKELCDIERYEYIFHILVWGLSLTLTIPLYILENNNTTLYPIMGNATFWCWITTKHGNYRMMFFFGPLWIVFFFNAFVYISMIIICKKRDKDMKPSVVGNTIAKRCNLYLLVLFLTWYSRDKFNIIDININIYIYIYIYVFFFFFFFFFLKKIINLLQNYYHLNNYINILYI